MVHGQQEGQDVHRRLPRASQPHAALLPPPPSPPQAAVDACAICKGVPPAPSRSTSTLQARACWSRTARRWSRTDVQGAQLESVAENPVVSGHDRRDRCPVAGRRYAGDRCVPRWKPVPLGRRGLADLGISPSLPSRRQFRESGRDVLEKEGFRSPGSPAGCQTAFLPRGLRRAGCGDPRRVRRPARPSHRRRGRARSRGRGAARGTAAGTISWAPRPSAAGVAANKARIEQKLPAPSRSSARPPRRT